MRKAPSLRNNNGAVQLRVRIDGKDNFINRLGRWDDPAAVAKAQVLSAQIWSDYQSGVFDKSLRIYQPLLNGSDVALLELVRVNAEMRMTWTPETEPALMRASLPARLGQEKPHETQTPQPRADHPQAAHRGSTA